ncbi:hypothetical protein D3C81_1317620 [compost metagenome]
MGAVVYLGQVLEVQVSVNLCGGDVRVAKQVLHRAQVLGRLQHMAGEGVPQHVRMQVLAQLAHAGLAHAQLDRPRAQALAALADEQRLVDGHALAPRQPGLQRLARLAPDRQLAHLVALAEHPHQAGGEIQLRQVQAGQLGQAQAGGIEQFEHGLVAAGEKIVRRRALQQLLGAVGVEQFRQALLALGRAQAGARVVTAMAFADQVAVQPAHRGEEARQAGRRQALAVQAGEQAAQPPAVQLLPALQAGLAQQGEQLVEVAAVAGEAVRRQLALAAQVFEVGVQFALHGRLPWRAWFWLGCGAPQAALPRGSMATLGGVFSAPGAASAPGPAARGR